MRARFCLLSTLAVLAVLALIQYQLIDRKQECPVCPVPTQMDFQSKSAPNEENPQGHQQIEPYKTQKMPPALPDVPVPTSMKTTKGTPTPEQPVEHPPIFYDPIKPPGPKLDSPNVPSAGLDGAAVPPFRLPVNSQLTASSVPRDRRGAPILTSLDNRDEIFPKDYDKTHPNPCIPLGAAKKICLPTYLLVGAMKAGTTFLDRHLQKHPQLARHRRKEMFFFNKNYDRGLEWYSQQWEGATPEQLLGESTPLYLPSHAVPERIYDVIPRAKIIMILRDPIYRSFSQFTAYVARGLPGRPVMRGPNGVPSAPPYTFENLVKDELHVIDHCKLVNEVPLTREQITYPEFPGVKMLEEIEIPIGFRRRVHGPNGTLLPDDGKENVFKLSEKFYASCMKNCTNCFPRGNVLHDNWGSTHPSWGLISKSIYYPQVKHWLKFFRRDQILILENEWVEENPGLAFTKIEDFLGIDRWFVKANGTVFEKHNVSKYNSTINPETADKLAKFFEPFNTLLYDLIGEDLKWTTPLSDTSHNPSQQ